MLFKPDISSEATYDHVNAWHTLSRTIQSIRLAKSQAAATRLLAKSFNEIGFQVILTRLDEAQTALRVRFILPYQYNKKIYPVWHDNLPHLSNMSFSLATLGVSNAVLETQAIETVTLQATTLQDIITADIEQVLKHSPDLADTPLVNALRENQEITLIVMALWHTMNRNQCDILFITSGNTSMSDIPLASAYHQGAISALAERTWRSKAMRRKKNAQMLQDVTKIVSSTLELDTVLTTVLDQLWEVIPYDSAAISLEDRGVLKIEASRGFDSTEAIVGITIPADENLLYQEMKRTRNAIFIPNIQQDQRYIAWAGTRKIRSWIGVPLILHDKIIGQISIDSFKEHALQMADQQLVFSFAQLVSSAIQNARFFENINRTANELRALLDGAREVSSSLHTERVIYLMADRLQKLMNVAVVVYLVEQPSQILKPTILLETHLDQLTEIDIALGKRLARQTIDQKQSILNENPCLLLDDAVDVAEFPTTLMAAPFLVNGEAIGAITLSRHDTSTFAQSDLDLLTRFALQTGIAIDNSRLYEQLERRLQRENLINKLLRRLSKKLNIPSIANDIMLTAMHIAEADLASFVLLESVDINAYVCYAHDGNNLHVTRQNSTIPDMAAVAIDGQQIIFSNNYDVTYTKQSWVNSEVMGAVAIPIGTSDQILGVLGLFKQQTIFSNSNEIIQTLENIGWQAGVSIENALLFQQVNEYANTLQAKVNARTTEIQKQKEQTDAILEGAGDSIIIISSEGNIDYINPAFTTMTGYLLGDVKDKSFKFLISNQTLPQRLDQLLNTVLNGTTWRGDIKSKRKDDSIFDADLTIAPIFEPDGQIDKFVVIQRDISKKMTLDQLKSDFLITASHELRTPLTTIQGYTELLLNREFSRSESENFLKYIYEQSARLSTLVSDFLDISRIEEGSAFELSPSLLNPASIFVECIAQWQAEVPDRSIELIQPEVWPKIKVDPDRLKQTLDKLLSNAVKFSPDGGNIIVTVSETLTNLFISIQDKGIGMNLEEQSYLFETFWRANASSIAAEGTGLSLAVVKHVIEAHGGKIWVASENGKGTIVNFTLPLPNGTATVLIIEDDPQILEIQEKVLSNAGLHIITANTGKAGLELANSQYPDLIILDLMLPNSNGEDILFKLKATPLTQKIPVVVVSAKSALANIEYAFAIGATDFVTKPFDLDEFLGRIKIALMN